MLKNTWFVLGASTAIFVAGFSLGSLRQAGSVAHAQAGKHVYELRTYTAPDGKLGELQQALPRSHGAHLQQARHEERPLHDAAGRARLAEHADLCPRAPEPRGGQEGLGRVPQPIEEWKKVSAESQVNGKIVSKVVSVFGDPTDYSPMK